MQRKRSQQRSGDTAAIYGPPDKRQHFSNDDDFKVGKKKKDTSTSNSTSNKPKIGGKVKAKYDEQWFTGELIGYNKDIDQWTIYLKDDNYTDYVIFPDKDVKVE